MKKILIITFIAFFTNCKNPKVTPYDHYEAEDERDKFYLEDFNAKEKKYSILILGIGYFGQNISVSNCDTIIYNDSVKTSKYHVFAKMYRINNLCKTKIADFNRDHIIKIDSNLSSKYKFIYIERDFKDSLKITYTKNHMPIM